MLKILNKLQRIKSLDSVSVIAKSFATKEKSGVESLAIEPTDDLYDTYQKEDFKRLYLPGYQKRIPGFASTKGTKYYSLRSDIGIVIKRNDKTFSGRKTLQKAI